MPGYSNRIALKLKLAMESVRSAKRGLQTNIQQISNISERLIKE